MDSAVLRILDVNINRTREALRVVEDHVRLERDDADAAAAVKGCRHMLRAYVEACGAEALLAARDITGDVGRALKTPAELSRVTPMDVVRAAFVRAAEATRVLGEYGKLVSGTAADLAEQIRYRVYELEQRVLSRGALRQRMHAVRLYVLITAELCRADWLATAEAALRGGTTCVQLREKSLDGGELLSRARRLRALTDRYGALLIMNDRPDIARLAGADGVHVGQTDLSVGDVRRSAGGELLVGKSTHTLEEFRAALAELPDYVAIGPMFATDTKPQEHIAGIETLRAVRPLTELPVVAIGGITPQRASAVREAGATALAACAAVIGAADPEAAARAFVDVDR